MMIEHQNLVAGLGEPLQPGNLGLRGAGNVSRFAQLQHVGQIASEQKELQAAPEHAALNEHRRGHHLDPVLDRGQNRLNSLFGIGETELAQQVALHQRHDFRSLCDQVVTEHAQTTPNRCGGRSQGSIEPIPQRFQQTLLDLGGRGEDIEKELHYLARSR